MGWKSLEEQARKSLEHCKQSAARDSEEGSGWGEQAANLIQTRGHTHIVPVSHVQSWGTLPGGRASPDVALWPYTSRSQAKNKLFFTTASTYCLWYCLSNSKRSYKKADAVLKKYNFIIHIYKERIEKLNVNSLVFIIKMNYVCLL